MSEDNNKKDSESNSNFLGLPIINFDQDSAINKSVVFNDANEQNLKDMIFKLENEIRSGNVTPYTCELYRQISQIATFDKIVLDSTIIKPADLTMLQEKVRDFEIRQNQENFSAKNDVNLNQLKPQNEVVIDNNISQNNDINYNNTPNIQKEPIIKLTEMSNDQIAELRKGYFEVRQDYKQNQEYQEEQLFLNQSKDPSKSI